MTVEAIGRCEKHELPLDENGECQLCRLSDMPVPHSSSNKGKWVWMLVIAALAGALTWAIASFEPAAPPPPPRGAAKTAPSPQTRGVAPSPPSIAREQTDETSVDVQAEPPANPSDQAAAWAEARAEVRIIMYSTDSCPDCDRARRYLMEAQLAFTEHDVDSDPVAERRLRELRPERPTPTFELDDLVLVGFSRDDFEAARTRAASKRLSPGVD